MLLPIHILAGGLAIILGGVALSVKKGGTIHRRSGMLFVYAMVVMGVTASVLEFLKNPVATSVIAPLMAVYFVGTALTTVRPVSRWTRVINAAALTAAVGLALVSILGGVRAINTPGLSSGRVPFRIIGVMSFILATVLLLAAAGDVAKVLPYPFTTQPMRQLPILLLFGVMFYWLWRVRARRALPVVIRHE